MSDQLYESLKEIYISLTLEKESLENHFPSNENDCHYQFYKNRISTLDSRIRTLASVIHVFESYNLSKEEQQKIPEPADEKDSISRQLQILDIQEKERQRIARDLHDTSLQNLAHLVHKIELSSMYIDEDPIKAKLELAAVNKSLKSIIQEIRNTIFDLRPMTFDDLGLKESFDRLIDKLKESSKLEINYKLEEIGCSNSLILMTIFRIVEECINNAIKHSGGSKVYFELKKGADNNCIIIVSDNGKSFKCDEVLSVEDRHFGLCILKERVELLSGNIEIDSKPETGTTIKIVIPLSA